MGRLCRFAVVVSVGVFVLGAVGCTPGDPDPEASATSSPPVSSAPASPPETDEERAERERGEHAIEVYVKSAEELERLLGEGASEPSEKFKEYADGSYLDAASGLLEQVSDSGAHLEGSSEIVGIWVNGEAAPEKVRLVSCEDGTGARYIDRHGKPLSDDKPMALQTVDVEPVTDDSWKVTYVETEFFTSFEGTECADAA